MKKFQRHAVQYLINHNVRNYGGRKPSNEEIDFERTPNNYFLTPESHGRSAQEIKKYYNDTLKNYYQYGSKKLVTLVEWITTAPPGLTESQEHEFFEKSYNFFNSLYGEQNCVVAVVHSDEKVFDHKGVKRYGQNHMHYCFIPAIINTDKKISHKASKYEYRVCADRLFKKKDLLQFHPLYQQYLDTHLDFKCVVHKSEIGKSYLQNYRSVEHLKDKTKIDLAREHIKELEQTVERSQVRDHVWGGSGSWGSSSWGTK